MYQRGNRQYILYEGPPSETTITQKNAKEVLVEKFHDINKLSVDCDPKNNYFDQVAGWTTYYRSIGLEKAVELVSLEVNNVICQQELDCIVSQTFNYLKGINESLSTFFINIRSFQLQLSAAYR